MENKIHCDLSWINLINDEIILDKLLNKKIQIFYNFFNKVCLESFPNQISKFIKNYLTKIYESLLEKCLSSKFNDFLDEDIYSEKNQILNFIKNPKQFFLKCINTNISEIILEHLYKSYLLQYLETLKNFCSIISTFKIGLKEKVVKLEIKLKNKEENDLIQRFKEQNNRDIDADEKDKLLRENPPQKIFFDKLNNIENVTAFLNDIEKLLKKYTDHINILIKKGHTIK